MTPGCTVELIDHVPLLTGAGLRAGSRWTVATIHAESGTANIADRSGAIVACCVPVGRLREVAAKRAEAANVANVADVVTDEDF